LGTEMLPAKTGGASRYLPLVEAKVEIRVHFI